jgi:peptidoglycan/xylan/chitin deacetylase (PgdA/CDA1 family)
MRVAQCWDDGDVDDIKLVDILKRCGAKATFNITPGGWKSERRVGHVRNGYEVWRLSLDEMKDVYKGFKVAGHTMTHVHLSKVDPAWAMAELVECKKYIAKHFGFEEIGMAYPCGDFDDAVKEMVRKAGYRYARTTRNAEGDLTLDDPMAQSSNCHFRSPDFWVKFEEARRKDADFYFWGHSFELLGDQERWDELARQMERISDAPGVKWIDVIDLFA